MVPSHTSSVSRRLTRGLGLALICGLLLGLSAFAAWAALSTAQWSTRASRASQLGVAYQHVSLALAAIEVQADEYRLDASPATRARLQRSQARLQQAARSLGTNGSPADRSVAAKLVASSRVLNTDLAQLMRGVDRANAPAVDRIDRERLQPALAGMQQAVTVASANDHSALDSGLRSAQSSQRMVRTTTAIVFMLCTLLATATMVLVRTRRRLDAARQAELERLRAAAFTDSLTTMSNLRAFHELLDRSLDDGARRCLILFDLDHLKRTNDTFGHQAGDELIKSFADGLRHATAGAPHAFRIGGDEFAVVLDDASAIDGFYLAQNLRRHLGIGPVGEQVSATAGIAETGDLRSKDELIRHADLALIEAKRSHRGALVYTADLETPASAGERLDHHHATTLATALARAVDAKDAYTHSHCETVAELCALIAEGLGLPRRRIAQIRLAGLLHDVGKIGIADRILQKPGPLNPDEVRVMQTHPTLGCHIVSAAELYEEAGWILHHHERLDGTGYPDRLSANAIPLESRIIMVADAFEAITADRPYRDRRSVAEALAELRRHAGTQFDVRCLEALEELVAAGVGPAAVADDLRIRTAA